MCASSGSRTRANCLEGNYPTVGPRMLDEGRLYFSIYIVHLKYWADRYSQANVNLLDRCAYRGRAYVHDSVVGLELPVQLPLDQI
jgi:hypothetical protein